MGCDIHIRLEMINKKGEYKPLDYYEVREDWVDEEDNIPTHPFYVKDIYDGRDYELFGLLAGVRSNYPEPIAEPRGIPNSANHFIKEEYEFDKKWIHTPTWLTLGELRKCWYEHKDDEILDEDGWHNVYIRLLDGIIKPFERRVAEYKYLFYESDAQLEEECRKYWDSARMVFWFDS